MFQNIRLFFAKIKNIASLGGSNIAASIINGGFWFFLATIMEKSEYGQIGFFLSFASIAAGLANVGLDRLIVVYHAKNEDVLSSGYSLGLLASLIVSVIAYVITQNIFLSLLIWAMCIASLTMSELNSKKRYTTYSKYFILRRILSVGASLAFYPFLGINGIILGYFVSNLIGLNEFFYYLKNKKNSISLLKPKISFMVNACFSNMILLLFWWGDKLLIGTIFGNTMLGSYQLAGQYLLLLYAIPNALMIYLLPQESQGLKNKKIKIYSIGISVILFIVSIFVVPYFVNGFLPAYTESILAIQIMSVGIIPISISIILESALIGKELTRPVTIASASQIVTYFILLVILGQQYGLIGIAVAFMISTIIRLLFVVLLERSHVVR